MANDIVQTIAEARVDARSLSEFVFKPADFMVARRLAPSVRTLQYYVDFFNTIQSNIATTVSAAQSSLNNSVAEAQSKVAYIETTVQDAINNTAIDGGVLADTFVTATKNGKGMVARNQREKNFENLSVKDFGALGVSTANTVADWTVIGSSNYYPNLAAIQVDYPHVVSLDDTIDWVGIQASINFMSSKGGGDVWMPAAGYRTNRPLDMKPFVSLTGENPSTTIRKIADTPNAAGKNVILYGDNFRQARVSNLQLVGNRTNYADGNVVTMDGVYFTSANYCEFSHVRISNCKAGWHFQSSWLINLNNTVSSKCQEFGFKLTGANTSFTIVNHTNWGTGGGYYIASAQYTTIICPANDHIDYGGLPNDPFLPEGSGGNHLQPSYLYQIIGSQVTILSGGMENSATQFMYCEGSNVSINNPAVYTTVGHSTGYKFLQVRGTAKSTVNIVGADRLFTAKLAPSLSPALGRSMIYVERSGFNRQIVSSDSLPSSGDSFGIYTIYQTHKNHEGSPSIISPIKDYKINLNQSNMQVGDSTPFISEGVDNVANITLIDGKKILTLSGNGSTHKIPLRTSGSMFMLDCLASIVAAGQYVTIQVVDSAGSIIKQWQNNEAIIDVRYDTFYSASTLPLFLEFKPKTGQSIKFERLEFQQVG